MGSELRTHGSTKSTQVVKTPKDFLDAVVNIYGYIDFDLAANEDNKVAPYYFSEEDDSLKQDWHKLKDDGFNILWLNPPFKRTGIWMKKCLEESRKGARILSLVLASVGSNWFKDYVVNNCNVIFLNGRLKFEGHKNPYPKDLMLLYWDINMEPKPFIWEWRKPL